MLKRQPGKSDSKDASAYSRRAAAADSVWVAQDRLRNESGPALRKGADRFKWPFERGAYAVRKKMVWPLEDRAESMSAPARARSVAAAILLAAGAGVAGLVWAAPDGPHSTPPTTVAATPPPLVAVETAHQEAPQPTLHGAAPDFKAAAPKVPSAVDPATAIVKSTPSKPTSSKSATSGDATATPSSAEPVAKAAQASAVNGPPAGPAAISVARDFASAFVLYETGSSDDNVRKKFGATATPALAKALLRRPPRLPANVKVPKAKVVNVVPAPSSGRVYPVSVSLLRVGLTSELRLEMEQLKGDGWRVTNVLG
jgi:hypothetical protein